MKMGDETKVYSSCGVRSIRRRVETDLFLTHRRKLHTFCPTKREFIFFSSHSDLGANAEIGTAKGGVMNNARSVLWVAVVSIKLAPVATSAGADSQKIAAAINQASNHCRGISQQIWEFKEVGVQEVKSAALLVDELTKLGYKVTCGRPGESHEGNAEPGRRKDARGRRGL